jgi:hypothetical protein
LHLISSAYIVGTHHVTSCANGYVGVPLTGHLHGEQRESSASFFQLAAGRCAFDGRGILCPSRIRRVMGVGDSLAVYLLLRALRSAQDYATLVYLYGVARGVLPQPGARKPMMRASRRFRIQAASQIAIGFGLLTIKKDTPCSLGESWRAPRSRAISRLCSGSISSTGSLTVIAGADLRILKHWAGWLVLAIVIGAFVVFGAFACTFSRVARTRKQTVLAMTLRTVYISHYHGSCLAPNQAD